MAQPTAHLGYVVHTVCVPRLQTSTVCHDSNSLGNYCMIVFVYLKRGKIGEVV